MASVIITPAAVAALELDAVRQQCRIDDDAEDAYLTGVVIPAACLLFETETRCRLLNTVMEDTFPAWPRTGRIDLGWGRVSAVTSVSYSDQAGELQALDPALFQVDAGAYPAEVHRAPGAALPAMQQHPAALRVRYVAGFGADASAVPTNARLWLLLHVGHFYNNREAGFSASGNDMKPLLFASGLISEWQRTPI